MISESLYARILLSTRNWPGSEDHIRVLPFTVGSSLAGARLIVPTEKAFVEISRTMAPPHQSGTMERSPPGLHAAPLES